MKKIFFLAALSAVIVSCGTSSKVTPSATTGASVSSNDVGYGTVDESKNAYATSTVKVNEKEMSSYSNIYDYLKGRVAGLEIGNTTGGTPTIRIRGSKSLLFDSNPLILVDGTEMSDISGLNPQDVASVDVLKDASAAIYGSRGANGVILIKTKTAQEAAAKAAAEKKAAKQAAKAAKSSKK